jgi:flavin reductase (DIM6/NTAB) family NADH-FMN oxidoreductase RutF
MPPAAQADMLPLPLHKAFQLIEPGPVVLVTTAFGRKKNIMTLTWHMVLDFSPQIACVIGPWDYTFNALSQKKECVLAIPTIDLAARVVDIGSCSGSDTDKFKKFALTPVKAKSVKPPLIAECLANIECRVADYIDTYNIFILEAVHAWIDNGRKERRTLHANGDGTFIVDGRTLNLRKRMLKLPPGV